MMYSPMQGNFWGSTPWGAFGIGALGIILALVFVAAVIALKGYALWNAAKRDEKWWFIALLIVNTAGILELIYLFFVVKKWHKGVLTASTKPNANNNG